MNSPQFTSHSPVDGYWVSSCSGYREVQAGLCSRRAYIYLGRDKNKTKQTMAGNVLRVQQGTAVDVEVQRRGLPQNWGGEGLPKALGICSLLLDISFPWFFQTHLKCQYSEKPSPIPGLECTHGGFLTTHWRLYLYYCYLHTFQGAI